MTFWPKIVLQPGYTKKIEIKNMGKCVISSLPILPQKIQLYFTIDSKVHSKSFDFLDILHKGSS